MIIAFCDDNPVFLREMEEAVAYWKTTRGLPAVSLNPYNSSEDFLYDWEEGRRPDVLFLDIEFGTEKSGLEIARIVRRTDSFIPIIFVTSHEKYAMSGYEVDAYRFVKKPIEKEKIADYLDSCHDYINMRSADRLDVRDGEMRRRLPLEQICFIQSDRHNALIRTVEGKEYTVPLQKNFEDYIAPLPEKYFLRCHKSFIVNLLNIQKYSYEKICFSDDSTVPISKAYRKEVSERLKNYIYSTATE